MMRTAQPKHRHPIGHILLWEVKTVHSLRKKKKARRRAAAGKESEPMKKSAFVAVVAALAAAAGALVAIAVYLRRREKELDEYEHLLFSEDFNDETPEENAADEAAPAEEKPDEE